MEAVSLYCQSAHQGKCSSALSGILWLSLASLDLMLICRRCDKKSRFSEEQRTDNDEDCGDDVLDRSHDDEGEGNMKSAF